MVPCWSIRRGCPTPLDSMDHQQTHDVPTNGKFIYVQMILGAAKWSIEGLGYKDNI
jgi:hypothetical protein